MAHQKKRTQKKRIQWMLSGAAIGFVFALCRVGAANAQLAHLAVGTMFGVWLGSYLVGKTHQERRNFAILWLSFAVVHWLCRRLFLQIWPSGFNCCATESSNRGGMSLATLAAAVCITLIFAFLWHEIMARTVTRRERLKWNRFREANRELIESIGWPALTIETEDHFKNFLIDAYLDELRSSSALTGRELNHEKCEAFELLINNYFDAGYSVPILMTVSQEDRHKISQAVASSFCRDSARWRTPEKTKQGSELIASSPQ